MRFPPDNESIEGLLDRFVQWAERRPDIRAVALVGSFARGSQTEDSDIDIVVLTRTPAAYTGQDEWIGELDTGELIQSRDWGAITERRLKRPDGLEIEVGIGEPSWASTTPVDDGTRAVVRDGMRIVHDPDGLLRRLEAACSPPPD